MYSSHTNLIFSSICYMFLVIDKMKYYSIFSTLVLKYNDTYNNKLTVLYLRRNLAVILMICTECSHFSQVQEILLKNKLSTCSSYNKTILKIHVNKKNPTKKTKDSSFNAVFKRLDKINALVQFTSISLNDNLGEYKAKAFIHISSNILFIYFVYTHLKNVLFACLLFYYALC